MPKVKSFDVEHEDRKITVVIPETGDKSHDEYLELAEREKTLEQLRKLPQKSKPQTDKKDRAGAIREYLEFKRRGRKYY